MEVTMQHHSIKQGRVVMCQNHLVYAGHQPRLICEVFAIYKSFIVNHSKASHCYFRRQLFCRYGYFHKTNHITPKRRYTKSSEPILPNMHTSVHAKREKPNTQ